MCSSFYGSLKDHWPTPEERNFFQTNGYLVVPDALSPQTIESLNGAIDRCGHGQGGFFNRMDFLSLDNAFLELIDTPKVFAKICGFLGWNVWVNHTHYNIRPPGVRDQPYDYHWHRDGGSTSTDLHDQAPMTAIKVGFYLSDLSVTGKGNTYIIPLHIGDRNMMKKLTSKTLPPPEAVPLTLKPGSAVMFQQRVIHSQGSPNYSEITRKTIFMQWAFRWLFPVDTMTMGNLSDEVTDPIRRQLLGLDRLREPGRLSSRYYPSLEDIPLKKKLLTEVGLAKLSEIGPGTARQLMKYLNFETVGS